MTQLRILRGTIKDLQITKGYEDFVVSSNGKTAVGTLAVGAAVVGEVFNSTIFSTASHGAEISMEFFNCLVEDQRVVGKFHQVGFKNGEQIEFVDDRSGDLFFALADRDTVQRLIWMPPYHEHGHVAHRKANRK